MIDATTLTALIGELIDLPNTTGPNTSPVYYNRRAMAAAGVMVPLNRREPIPRDVTTMALASLAFDGPLGHRVYDMPAFLNTPLDSHFLFPLARSIPSIQRLSTENITLAVALDRAITMAADKGFLAEVSALDTPIIRGARLPVHLLCEAGEMGFYLAVHRQTQSARLRLGLSPLEEDAIANWVFDYSPDSFHAKPPPKRPKADFAHVGAAFFYVMSEVFKEPPRRNAHDPRRPSPSLGKLLRAAVRNTREQRQVSP